MSVFDVVIAENKKYSRILTEKSILMPTTKNPITPTKRLGNCERPHSLRHKSNIDIALEYGYRKRRTNSQSDIHKIEEIKKIATDVQMVNLKDRKKTHWTASMRSNTEYTSTRELI